MVLALLALGLTVMIFNVFSGTALRRSTSGGLIGERLTQLLAMIVMFALGYLGVGVMTFGQPDDTSLTVLAVILLLGALFVTLVLRLVRDVVQALN